MGLIEKIVVRNLVGCGDEEDWWADEDSADGVYDYGCFFVFYFGWIVFHWDSI